MKSLDLKLIESDARLILEALQELNLKWSHICETSENEDEIADYGNDLTELRILMLSAKQQAEEKFGSNVSNFSRTPL